MSYLRLHSFSCGLFLGALVIAGCSEIQLVGKSSLRDATQQEATAVQRVYLVLVPPKEEKFGQESLLPEVISRRIQRELHNIGGHLEAYRMASDGFTDGRHDPYAIDLEATSILIIRWDARKLDDDKMSTRFQQPSAWSLKGDSSPTASPVLHFHWTAEWKPLSADTTSQYTEGKFRHTFASASPPPSPDEVGMALNGGANSIAHLIVQRIIPFRVVRPAVQTKSSWFAARWVVLPFSDDTLSIDGPVYARHLMEDALRASGYTVTDEETINKGLRVQGYTQGGQLNQTDPQKVAEWCDADFVIWGHLDKYEDINVGLVIERNITGSIRIWDAKNREWMEDHSVSAVRDTFSKSLKGNDIAGNFFTGLMNSWIEKARNKPLAKECKWFVAQAIAMLPRCPQQEKN